MRFKPDDDSLEYWIGMLVSPDTPVPEGFRSLELPSLNLGECWIYGLCTRISAMDFECYQKLKEGNEDYYRAGRFDWSFERAAALA